MHSRIFLGANNHHHSHLFPALSLSKEFPQPIVSLSLNPAIDLTYEISTLKHEQKTRAISTSYDPGGTGINVGRALNELKANSATCCITAGKMGEFLTAMLNHKLNNLYTLQVEGETRINTTILQHSPLGQYEINAAGPEVNLKQLNQIIAQFLQSCKQGIGILTGSLPPCVPEETYHNINSKLQAQGARAIIDVPVGAMKKALTSKPFLIKPNLNELEALTKKKLSSIEKIAEEARFLVQQGTSYVCVSMAEKGAILVASDNSYYANSPPVSIHSTVGAGDSMVAGLAHAFAQNKSCKQALILAVACGAGTANKPGTQLFNKEEIETLSNQIDIKALDI